MDEEAEKLRKRLDIEIRKNNALYNELWTMWLENHPDRERYDPLSSNSFDNAAKTEFEEHVKKVYENWGV